MVYFPCFDCVIWDTAATSFICPKCCSSGRYEQKKREGKVRQLEERIERLEQWQSENT